MNHKIFLILFLLAVKSGFAQENATMKRYASMIKPDELKDNLTIIASDAMEGRATGSRGQKMAAAFIADHFREIGLKAPVNNSYFQPFQLYSLSPGSAYVKVGENRYDNYKDILYSGDDETEMELTTEVIFAGLGNEEDLGQMDLKGKSILIVMERLNFFTMTQIKFKAEKAKGKGAKYVFAVPSFSSDDFDQFASSFKSLYNKPKLTLEKPPTTNIYGEVFYLKKHVAEKIFNTTFDKLQAASKVDASKSPLHKMKTGVVNFQITRNLVTVHSENVLGYLAGTDKKDELVIVTAHFDHIGKNAPGERDIINNGADDDGSGTVAVMQLAKVFAQAKKDGHGPRRSMLFMTFAGEENGLLGSKYYVGNPVFSLANTVVDLNIDMIGRKDLQHKDSSKYVYVIGADKLSADLHHLNERLNKTYTHLNFDYVYNNLNHPDRLYYRSDHWNFANQNIPIIFYFDGIHEDYHKVSDEVSKIDFDLLALRSQCVFYTAWEIANREERLMLDKK